MLDQPTVARALLYNLVAIPSLSRQEAAASAWLVEQMKTLGYERAFVDEAGNAVGEMGRADARHTIILLGHIDTVPGNIPVRIEESAAGSLLYGRGSVDAKGPLATFVAAVAKLGAAWTHSQNLRLVVVGAVEEEYATSKGARFIAARFDGRREPLPAACIIGEPSSWRRVTLFYKGRILVELQASQPMAHSAGPDAGVATVAVDLWHWISQYADRFNQHREKVVEQLTPSLRAINTSMAATMHDRVTTQIGIRLPLGFNPQTFADELLNWAAQRINAPLLSPQYPIIQLQGPLTQLAFHFHAHEPAWRCDRNTLLVRSFLAAIRTVEPSAKPAFVSKTGTSDMNVVGPMWGCPILAYGPGDSELDHTPHEHINLAEYWQAILVVEEALRNLSRLLADS
ncbi:MAG: M20/M25/M40 family metallo-hydrolase [Chloroflexota bacterium]|nr:M20/M25/M40 family metallo-hydrolase [Chloroflexota bacterium]